MEVQTGTFLKGGEYRIEKMLGRGGFAVTYLATQLSLKRKVAIKAFSLDGPDDMVAVFKARFIREAQTIAEMDHRQIIKIFDVFEEGGTAFYAMEYLEGGNLSSRIPAQGMSEKDALDCILLISDALVYLHAKKVLHLDVKPANIMFRSNGEPVLIDFGLSKHYDDSKEQTTSSIVAVSDGYAPAEQYECLGVSSFSASTDVYSLGATLYHMLSGTRPPTAHKIMEHGLPVLPRGCSDEVFAALKKAMSPRRGDRMQTVNDFVGALSGAALNDDTQVVDVPDVPEKKRSAIKGGVIAAICFVIACLFVVACIVFRLLPRSEDGFKDSMLTISGVDYPMVLVRGGHFMMGADNSDLEADETEKPPHSVTLSDYYIGQYEVTQALWYAVMGESLEHKADGRTMNGVGPDMPMYYVSYRDCQDFITRLTEITGKEFSMPTESQWEFASRGGADATGIYKFSGDDVLAKVGWYDDDNVHAVGELGANDLGIHDMSGNVWEWCEDVYDPDWYRKISRPTGTLVDPAGPHGADSSPRVCRGGSWSSSENACRVINRNSASPESSHNNVGFRLALKVK